MLSLSPHTMALVLLLGVLTGLWILHAMACRIRDEIGMHDLRLRSLSLRDRLELERLRAEGLAAGLTEEPTEVDIVDDDGNIIEAAEVAEGVELAEPAQAA